MKTLTYLAIWGPGGGGGGGGGFNNQTGSILVHIYTLIYINLRVKYGSNLIRTLGVKIKNMKKEQHFFRGHVGRQDNFFDVMNFLTSWHTFLTSWFVLDAMTHSLMLWRIFWRHDVFWTSWRTLDVKTHFWRHDVFLTSWRTFWRHDAFFDVMTNLLSWRVLDVMTYLVGRHDTFFDVMTCFWRHDALCWRHYALFNVMTFFGRHDAFLTSWRFFWCHDVFWTSWRTFWRH